MKAFSYSPPNQYIQDIILEPGTYTFGAKAVFAYGYNLTVGVKTASGNWIAIPYEIKVAGVWNKDVSKTFTITERCVQFNLMYSGTFYNCNILSPWLKKGSTSTPPSPNTEDLLESLQDGGQVPIQKEWVAGDRHRNSSEIIDYIYVRGTSSATSYWYQLIASTDIEGIVAGAPPSGGSVPTGYKSVS